MIISVQMGSRGQKISDLHFCFFEPLAATNQLGSGPPSGILIPERPLEVVQST